MPALRSRVSRYPWSFGGFAASGQRPAAASRPFDNRSMRSTAVSATRGLHLALTLLRLRHGASCANAQSTPMLGPMLVSRCVQCPPPPPPTTLKQITARPRQTSDVRCIRYPHNVWISNIPDVAHTCLVCHTACFIVCCFRFRPDAWWWWWWSWSRWWWWW